MKTKAICLLICGVCFLFLKSFPQTVNITGTLKNSNGDFISGALIQLQNHPNIQTYSAANGTFTLSSKIDDISEINLGEKCVIENGILKVFCNNESLSIDIYDLTGRPLKSFAKQSNLDGYQYYPINNIQNSRATVLIFVKVGNQIFKYLYNPNISKPIQSAEHRSSRLKSVAVTVDYLIIKHDQYKTQTLAIENYSLSMGTITMASNLYSPPSISAPTTSTGSFTVEITYSSWSNLTTNWDHYELEESTVSSSTGFVNIHFSAVTHASPFNVQLTKVQGTYYYRARICKNTQQGYSSYSNVVKVVVSAPASIIKIVNNSSYPIISASIDNVEKFYYPNGILSGGNYQLDIPQGNHSLRVANGFYDGTSKFEMYISTQSYTQPNGTYTFTFENPTINQLLTKFKTTGTWEGEYWVNLNMHMAKFVFNSNGSWAFYDDGVKKGTGTYSLVARYPDLHQVNFKVGPTLSTQTGYLNEVYGYFYMNNGPTGWEKIRYTYKGN